MVVIREDVDADPFAPASGRFALSGTTKCATDSVPSVIGTRPWGLLRAERSVPSVTVPQWRYDHGRQLAVGAADGRPLIESTNCGPSAVTTASKDGEDPPSSEDWIND